MTQAQKVKVGEPGPTPGTINTPLLTTRGSHDYRTWSYFTALDNSTHHSTRMQSLTRPLLKGITMLKLILLVIAALIYLAVLFGMTGDADVAKLLAGSGLAVVIALCVDQPWRAV